ncbi:leucine-rich repeat domain-containing protein [[Mycoplasma] falconis]|uniref:Leucine-rich repeat domain-containing protein n=1 Tax=[Mycoplasma] falconis TaxID=92403 RepID=A0A501XB13_9BACT|nr:leucine-rich repeat protein [[Mycoplasma] falconis]TPE57760.1 leucine-rich repeat domain-containing protein [[Mycoplasma] falconis]
MKKNKIFLLGSLSAISTLALPIAAVSCGGEATNSTVEDYLLNDFKLSSKTLNLTDEKMTEIPQALFSYVNIKRQMEVSQKGLRAKNVIAASGISNIAQINLPKTLTHIQNGAFEGLSSVTVINFNEADLLYIGDNAFKGTFAPKSDSFEGFKLTLPLTVSNIGSYAFAQNSLMSVNLAELKDLKVLRNGVFANNLLTELDLANIEEVEDYALANNKFEALTIPASVLEFSPKAFDYNNAPKDAVKVKLTVLNENLKNYLKEELVKNPNHLYTIVE